MNERFYDLVFSADKGVLGDPFSVFLEHRIPRFPDFAVNSKRLFSGYFPAAGI
jgi:hypothetical protein